MTSLRLRPLAIAALCALAACQSDAPKLGAGAFPPTAAAPQDLDQAARDAEAFAQSFDEGPRRARAAALAAALANAARTTRAEQERGAQSQLRLGVILTQRVTDARATLAAQDKLLQGYPAGSPLRQSISASISRGHAAQQEAAEQALETAKSLAAAYPPELVAAQTEQLRRSFAARNLTGLSSALDRFASLSQRARGGAPLSVADLLASP